MLFDDRAALSSGTGIARYARSVGRSLPNGPTHQALRAISLPVGTDPLGDELELPALLEREEVDLFHSPLWLLPAILPCRAVVTVHDAIPATHPDLTSAAFWPVWERVHDEVRRAEAVVCPSEHARKEIVQVLNLAPDQVHVVPEAPAAVFSPRAEVDVRRRLVDLDVNESYLLVVGSLERRKNPDGVLEALALLAPDRRPPVLFVGPAAGFDLMAEAVGRGVGDRVRHLGVVPDDTLAMLYSGALALLACSHAEGFGLPVIEAWACGAPVIASSTTALAEVGGTAALLVEPDDPRALATAMERLAEDAPLRDELRRLGRARLDERFTTAHVTAAVARLYDLLEGRP